MPTSATKAKPEATPPLHGYMTDKDRYLDRLKRIEGQVGGVHRIPSSLSLTRIAWADHGVAHDPQPNTNPPMVQPFRDEKPPLRR